MVAHDMVKKHTMVAIMMQPVDMVARLAAGAVECHNFRIRCSDLWSSPVNSGLPAPAVSTMVLAEEPWVWLRDGDIQERLRCDMQYVNTFPVVDIVSSAAVDDDNGMLSVQRLTLLITAGMGGGGDRGHATVAEWLLVLLRLRGGDFITPFGTTDRWIPGQDAAAVEFDLPNLSLVEV